METFKFSTDPDFDRKMADVVGLYLNPREKALVLCVDEKSFRRWIARSRSCRYNRAFPAG